jgi:serine/threonine protein kinase
LSSALIIQTNRKFFLPISVLEALVTEDAIERELRGTIPTFASERPHLPSQIAQTSRKLFAILAYLGKGSLITAFLDEHITDSDLPLEAPLALVGQENQGMLSKVFANRRSRDINDFCRVQWYFLAPIFDRLHKHYELDDNVVLPFIKNEESSAQQGGYSEVWEVKIHPAHQQLRSSLVVGKEPSFAIKRLFSRYPQEFEREAGMLKAISKLKHRHLLELLMTYKLKGRYHLVFPYAKYNLRQLWNSVSIVDNAEWAAWSLQQMRGLASGLEQIHCFTPSSFKSSLSPILSPKSNSLIVEKNEEKYGRHGDLKPENILWFENEEGKEDHVEGLLVIADFGLGRFHRLESRSRVDPATIGGTATYAPPEVQLGSRVSRAYDIWSLACVYLEFATWLVGGWQDLIAFGDARAEVNHDYLEDDLFYTVVYDNPKQPEAIVRQGVQNWINDLCEKPNCSAFIHELLDLISQRMLRVDPSERISSEQLNWKLSRMLERATLDPNYLVKSKSEAFSRPKDETQQHDASSQHCTDLVNLISVLDKAFSRPKEETKQVATSPHCTELVKYNPIYGYTSASDIPLWVLGITCERDCSLVSKDYRKLGRASYEMTPLHTWT